MMQALEQKELRHFVFNQIRLARNANDCEAAIRLKVARVATSHVVPDTSSKTGVRILGALAHEFTNLALRSNNPEVGSICRDESLLCYMQSSPKVLGYIKSLMPTR